MELDCLLAFLDGFVEVAFTYLLALFVANGVERYYLSEIVLVATFFLERTVDICLIAVVHDIVFRLKRMPTPSLRSVFLRRASVRNNHCYEENYGNYMSVF